jgi:hypothetical protein
MDQEKEIQKILDRISAAELVQYIISAQGLPEQEDQIVLLKDVLSNPESYDFIIVQAMKSGSSAWYRFVPTGADLVVNLNIVAEEDAEGSDYGAPVVYRVDDCTRFLTLASYIIDEDSGEKI